MKINRVLASRKRYIEKNKKKSYTDLVTMMNREAGGSISNLKVNKQKQLAEYRSWVYSCVSLISDRVSTVPFRFYNKKTGAEITQTNKNFKIFTKPFFHPNDLMSFRFIKAFCQIQLDLCGMTCIYKAKNKLGQTWELWPLNMNDFRGINVDHSNFLRPRVNFTFVINNKEFTFDLSELICIYYPHPTQLWEAQSPIQAHAYAVDIDSYVEVYERDFFKNSARVDMVLTTEAQLDQEKADELKARWKSKFSGNFHDIAILDSGLKPEPLKFTNKDFEFLNLANWSKDKILSAYRVPPAKLGGTGNNRAESVTADISFNRESVQPRLTIWDEELTKEILFPYNENYEVRHENPVPRDRDLEVKEAKAYVGVPVNTINEFRKDWLYLDPVPGGDIILIPQGFIPLDKLGKYIDNQIQMSRPNQGENPNRHDDDEPHTNPTDGTDDRDDNPTDGRSLNLLNTIKIETSSRVLWNKYLLELLKNTNKDNLKLDTYELISSSLIPATISAVLEYFGSKSIEIDFSDWIIPISEKASEHYYESLFKYPKNSENWNKFVEEQFNCYPRIAKITNSLLKACINYSKWLIMTNNQQEMVWQVNSNECGHRGRLIKNKSFDSFGVGNTPIRFPGEFLNFYCDCTIEGTE
jgi:HK97 family phage portal protein